MSFYSQFSANYEHIFPFRDEVFQMLNSYCFPHDRETAILDVGCGTGHYTGAFAQVGVSAHGIDLDECMIESAKHHYPLADFSCINMLEIESLSRKFDFVFCIGNVLAHLNKQELIAFIRHVHNVLQPGGSWLFQVLNWELITQQKYYQFPVKHFPQNNLEFHRMYDVFSQSQINFNTTLIENEKVQFNDSVTLFPMSSNEYISIHQQAGFKLTGHFQDYRKTAYDSTVDSANIFAFTQNDAIN